MKTPTPTLIAALRVLASEIQSSDGVANAAIAEAADRLEEMRAALVEIRDSKFCSYENTYRGEYGIGVTDGHRYCAGIAHNVLD